VRRMIEAGRVKVRKYLTAKTPRRRDYLCFSIPKTVLIVLGNILGKEARVIVDEKKKRIIYEILDSSDKLSKPR